MKLNWDLCSLLPIFYFKSMQPVELVDNILMYFSPPFSFNTLVNGTIWKLIDIHTYSNRHLFYNLQFWYCFNSFQRRVCYADQKHNPPPHLLFKIIMFLWGCGIHVIYFEISYNDLKNIEYKIYQCSRRVKSLQLC